MIANKVAALLSLIALVSTAEARRAIVILKESSSLRQIQSGLEKEQSHSLRGLHFAREDRNGELSIEVEEVLENLNSLVVDVDSSEEAVALTRNPAVALVDWEVFHPAPRPVAGHRLTPINLE
ncbi:MAG: hypothetical protein N2578_09910, partial [Bdellovibrionaceae bacterium]|nr:hypothetical protein [Pseudobdellovibrionaceae bacterium]